MIEENKIDWRKPNYENEYGRVSDKEIDKMCMDGSSGSGDIIIEKRQYGRKITFIVHRVEKVGELVKGTDTLTRQRAIEELKRILKKEEKIESNQ